MKNFLFLATLFLPLFLFLGQPGPVAAISATINTLNSGGCVQPGSSLNIDWGGSGYDHVALAYRPDSAGSPPTWTSDSVAWNIAHPVSGSSYIWNVPTAVDTTVGYRLWIEAHSSSHTGLAMDYSDMPFGFSTACGGVSTTDTMAPSVPNNLTATVVSASQINLTWNAATDNVGVQGYKIYRGGVYLLSTAGVTFSESSLSPDTSYTYTVAAYDAAGNISVQSATAYASTPASQTAQPPVITNVRAENIVSSGAQIKWTTDKLSDSRVNYGTAPGSYSSYSTNVCDGGGFVTSHCINLMGLAPSVVYYVRASSYDGSLSASSSEYSFTAAPDSASSSDTVPPTAPSGLTASGASASQINIFWGVSTDNVGVLNYKIYRGSTFVAAVTGTTYSDTGLAPATSYSYKIYAADAAGNYSLAAYATGVTQVLGSSSTFPTVDIRANGTRGTVYLATPASYSISWSVIGAAACTPQGIWAGSGNKNTVYGYENVNGIYDAGLRTYTLVCSNTFGQTSDTVYVQISAPPTATATQDSFPPAAPSGLLVTLMNGRDAKLAWNDNSPSETETRVLRRLNGGEWFLITTLQANATSFLNSGLADGTYEYSVQACNAYGCSSSGNASMTVSAAAVQNGRVDGYIFDGNGSAAPEVQVRFALQGGEGVYWGKSGSAGYFSLQLPAGNYSTELFPALAASDFMKPAQTMFALLGGETKQINLRLLKSEKIIIGSVFFGNGLPVTDANVGAYNSLTGGWVTTKVSGNGSYTLKVAGGKWLVSPSPADWTAAKWVWRQPPKEALFSDTASVETARADFLVPFATTKIVVKTVRADGSPLSGAGVVLDSVSVKQLAPAGYIGPLFYGTTDAFGAVSFSVTGGTFYARASLPMSANLISPEEAQLSVISGEERTSVLQFRSQDAVVRGTVILNGARVSNALVWTWSEKGGSSETRTSATGEFALSVARGARWHIGASKVIQNAPYKSAEASIDVAGDLAGKDLVLVSSGAPLPPPAEVIRQAADVVVAEISNGAKITLPRLSAARDGTIKVNIKPQAEISAQPLVRVVGTAYDITVEDQAGQDVKKFSEKTELTFPYSDALLKEFKVSEGQLLPSYYDDKIGAWIKLQDYFVDKANKRVVARVDHLTRFALVAAADTVPPAAPAAILVAKVGNANLITWVNPSSDFDHAKIYRSLIAGALGSVVFSEVRGSSASDAAVLSGLNYYYTVRAVDPAGNESANTDQASAAGGSARAKAEVFTRNLTVGATGEDVKLLQRILIAAGVYPEALITGYFGALTKAAVSRFQEKYSAEILVPNGLQKGTGFVGSSTLKKLRSLSS